MTPTPKCFAISNPKTKQQLGYIIAEKIVTDPHGFILFIEGSKTVAMFPVENIEIGTI